MSCHHLPPKHPMMTLSVGYNERRGLFYGDLAGPETYLSYESPTGGVSGVDALMAWLRPHLGDLHPDSLDRLRAGLLEDELGLTMKSLGGRHTDFRRSARLTPVKGGLA